MRILVVGDFAYDHQEPSFCRALRGAGASVEELRVWKPWRVLDAGRRAQFKYVVGPEILRANARLVAMCARVRPHVVLAWRTPWLYPAAVKRLQRLGSRLVLYNNDDPFGPDRHFPIWRAFRNLIPLADACFAYRSVNVDEYRAAGARRVSILRSYYDPAVHRRIALTAEGRRAFDADVTFVGHHEHDGRTDALEALMDAGLRVRVFGGGWERLGANPRWRHLLPIKEVFGDDYARALSATKIGLVFLSKRNRDEYTRRCFEIPAVGTMMLAPRTPELLSLFTEDVETAYYSNTSELVEKACLYASDERLRARVSHQGHVRCLADGHDALSRARTFLEELDALFGRPELSERAVIFGP